MPVRDSNLMIRASSAGALTAGETLVSKEVNGTLPNGLALQVNVPITPTGTSPVLTVSAHGSSSSGCDSGDTLLFSKTITAAGEYIIPIQTPLRSIGVKADVTGTSPSFGSAEIALVLNVAQPWTRGVEFHS